MRAAGASAAVRLSCLGLEMSQSNGGPVLGISCCSDSSGEYSSEDNWESALLRSDALVGQRLLERVRKRKIEREDLYCSQEAAAWDDFGPLDRAPFTQEQDLSQQ